MKQDTIEYKGHAITLQEDWRFRVDGPLFDGGKHVATFDGMNEAKAAIDGRREAEVKQKKAEVVMSIPCLDANGVPVIARGIHAQQSRLLGVNDSSEVYPDVPFIKTALGRLAALREEMGKLNTLVNPYRVNANRGYGWVKPERYEELCAAFEQEFNKKKANAETQQPRL